jgi:ABC-type microcin C transport system permease subunit YejB
MRDSVNKVKVTLTRIHLVDWCGHSSHRLIRRIDQTLPHLFLIYFFTLTCIARMMLGLNGIVVLTFLHPVEIGFPKVFTGHLVQFNYALSLLFEFRRPSANKT